MAINSISDAYGRYGPAGLSEAGKIRRNLSIAGEVVGTLFLVSAVALFIFLILNKSDQLLPNSAANKAVLIFLAASPYVGILLVVSSSLSLFCPMGDIEKEKYLAPEIFHSHLEDGIN